LFNFQGFLRDGPLSSPHEDVDRNVNQKEKRHDDAIPVMRGRRALLCGDEPEADGVL
jgi:hypothetical protein